MQMSKTMAQTAANETLKINEKKWGKALMGAGWTAIPNILLEHQQQLGLDSTDLNILLQIAKHWWYPDQAPYPGKKAIATRIGVSPRTVQRRLNAMVKAGIITRKARTRTGGGNDTTEFYFAGLIERATPYAEDKLKIIAARRKEDSDRSRKRGLRLVKPVS
jgi:DNA-binding transcriptional regulator YhcF (GntR family)